MIRNILILSFFYALAIVHGSDFEPKDNAVKAATSIHCDHQKNSTPLFFLKGSGNGPIITIPDLKELMKWIGKTWYHLEAASVEGLDSLQFSSPAIDQDPYPGCDMLEDIQHNGIINFIQHRSTPAMPREQPVDTATKFPCQDEANRNDKIVQGLIELDITD